MAESLKRKPNNDAINDDMIKDALKTGLSSIKASDYLVNKTLLKCQEEIEKGKQKSRVFIPWILKLGTPLAAGALVLTLVINSGNLRMKSDSTNMAPQASANGLMSKFDAEEAQIKAGQAPAPTPSPEESVASQEIVDKEFDEDIKFGVGLTADNHDDISGRSEQEEKVAVETLEPTEPSARSKASALYSSAKRESGISKTSITELEQLFTEIVNIYNQANETGLILNEGTILRVTCLPKEGVSARTLIESEDYDEVLSDEGYWALPLVDQNGNIEKILTVCDYDQVDPDAVSGMDITYTIERNKYVVSELSVGDSIGSDLKDLLSEILYDLGDIRKSGLVIVDINNGTDFIAIVDMGERKMIVPLLMNNGIFGLENKKIYNWSMFTRIVGKNLEQ